MRSAKKSIGLTFRYMLHLVMVGAFLSGLLVWNASNQQKRIVLREMEQRAKLLSESLASAVGAPYLSGDLKAVRHIFVSASEIGDVASIVLMDPQGKTVIQNGLLNEDRNLSEILGAKTLRVWKDSSHIHAAGPVTVERENSAGGTKAPAASSAEVLGYVHLALSLERANEYLQNLILRSAIATVVIMAFGNVLAFIFFRREILNPIQKLAEAMTEVRSGHLESNLGVIRNDEIGTLTKSFNKMTENLKRAEDGLRLTNSELGTRVKERTADLERALRELQETQDKMLQSQKLAAIGQLSSSVGHELRNPLAAISNAIYYIRDALKGSQAAKDDPTLAEFLDLADNEVKSSMAIIKDLLDFAHVGKLTILPVNLNTILKMLHTVVEFPKNVHIVEDYSPQMPVLNVDPQRMRQVFINLAANAVQSMPNGGRLFIRTRVEEGPIPGDPAILVVFEDTGTGMSAETMKRIFEPLFTTKAKGTGLGLCICKEIVESHGGKILVRSDLGKGSVFTVKLSGLRLKADGRKT